MTLNPTHRHFNSIFVASLSLPCFQCPPFELILLQTLIASCDWNKNRSFISSLDKTNNKPYKCWLSLRIRIWHHHIILIYFCCRFLNVFEETKLNSFQFLSIYVYLSLKTVCAQSETFYKWTQCLFLVVRRIYAHESGRVVNSFWLIFLVFPRLLPTKTQAESMWQLNPFLYSILKQVTLHFTIWLDL